MCIQFMVQVELERIFRRYHTKISEEFEWKSHVFPRYLAPVVLEEKKDRLVKPMHFGLIPFFEKNPKPKKVFHNARSETLAEKVSFKRAYAQSRCIVPIQSFFEYVGEKPNKSLAKFTPKGGKVILRVSSPDNEIMVEVQDTGIGIPKQDIDHIFEDFYRATNVKTPVTGLGLSIVKRIVEAHVGKIEVKSPCPDTKTGCIFTFLLPVNR